MKLVELLARELSEWPKGVHAFAQDQCADVYPWTGVPEYDDDQWIITDDCDVAMGSYISLDIDLAEDYATDIVTRAQWQVERDRQKGGEWKRHRGMKQPVDSEAIVEVKLRCGDIQQGAAKEFIWSYGFCDVAANIMKYRIISQPQAEEVEYRGPFPCAPIGETVNAMEFDIEFPSGSCSVESKTDQMETPFKWRDEVTELNAYIEKFTRERDALIERLAEEGFALIPAMTPVMGVADISFPIDEWQIGDIVEVVSVSGESAAPLGVFKITDIDGSEPKYELDDQYFPNHEQMKFIRRP